MLQRTGILWKEITLTLRGLRREPGFTLTSVLLLTLGIALTSAVFTLLWQIVYAQLPVPDPSRLFTFATTVTHIGRSESDVPRGATVSAPMYRYLAQHFTAASGTLARHGDLVNLETPRGTRHVRAELVSGNFFAVGGVKPVIGRALAPDDDNESALAYAGVLSYAFWEQAFGGSIAALSSSVRVNGVPFRIVGVAPPSFTGLIAGQAPQIYLSLSVRPAIDPGWNSLDNWGVRWLNVFSRLPRETSITSAEAQLATVYRAAVREELATEPAQPADYLRELAHERVNLIPASQGLHGMLDQWRQPLRMLQWLTAAVLLLTCINLAGLTMVRAVKQRQEMLVRYALGASCGALMRLHFIQTILLSFAGGIAGLSLARICAKLLLHLGRIDRGGALSSSLNAYALGVHWMVAVFAGFLIGIFPAWHAARLDLAGGLADTASSHSASRSGAKTRRALAAIQIALSLVLLIVAGLFAKSLHNLTAVPVGFNPDRLLVFSIDPKLAGSTAESAHIWYANIAREFAERPRVRSVAYGTGGPFPAGLDFSVLIPKAKTSGPKHEGGVASVIGPHYFATLGIPLLEGREFTDRDRTGSARGVIINQTLARKLFPKEDPVGQPVTVFNGLEANWPGTIIGVVADYQMSWTHDAGKQIYTCAQQAPHPEAITFYVRTVGDATLNEQNIREVVRRQAPMLSAFDVQTMSIRMAEFASRERAMTLLIAAFAAIALVISLVGIYGVIAYSSRLRTTEFGVRFAVGAQSGDILWLVFREAVSIVVAGVLLAIPIAWFGLRLARTQLSHVGLHDPAILITALTVLILSSLAAAVVPATRATRMNIQCALRHK